MKFDAANGPKRLIPWGSASVVMIAAGCVTAASLNCHQTETMRL
jgi:hypothetical protein